MSSSTTVDDQMYSDYHDDVLGPGGALVSDSGSLPLPYPSADRPAVDLNNDTVEQRVEDSLVEVEELSKRLGVEQGSAIRDSNYAVPKGLVLSVVVPVFNERKTICSTIARLLSLPVITQIIVVDDFSTDGTRDLLRQLAAAPGVQVVFKTRNQGKGAAVRTGFSFARGDIVTIQDADREYDPRDLLTLIQPILDGDADVVYGSRFLKDPQHDPSIVHRFGNGVLTLASNAFTGLRLTDMETCYKVFRRRVLRDISLRQNRFGFEPEITAKVARRRHRIVELPISYRPRTWDEGKKIGFKDGLNALYCIVRYGLAD